MNFASFVSFTLLPLGDALCFIYSSPIYVAIMSRIFLGIPLSLYKGFFGVILMTGFMFILQPSFLFHEGTVPEAEVLEENLMNATVIDSVKLGEFFSACLYLRCAFFFLLFCVLEGALL